MCDQGAEAELGWQEGGVSVTASDPPSLPQGANIPINDPGEVRLGECGWWGWGGGLAGSQRGQGP